MALNVDGAQQLEFDVWTVQGEEKHFAFLKDNFCFSTVSGLFSFCYTFSGEKPQVAAIIIRRPSSTFYVSFPPLLTVELVKRSVHLFGTAAVSAERVSVILKPKKMTRPVEMNKIRFQFTGIFK